MATTVKELMSSCAATFEGRPAVVDGGTTLSYGDLAERAETVGRALLAHGVEPGDRVALWASNRWEYVVSALGIQLVGAAVVPLNTRYRGHEAVDLLTRSRATALIVDRGFLGTDHLALLADAAPAEGLPHLRCVVDLNDRAAGTAAVGDVVTWTQFLVSGDDVTAAQWEAATAQVSADSVADILYTSGTTGVPKGVVSTQRQTLLGARLWAAGAGLTAEDTYAVVNPFFHSFGYKAGFLATLTAGGTVFPVAVFDADALMASIQEHRVTVMPGPPTLFTTLLHHPDRTRYDLSSLRFATCGATTVVENLFEDLVEVLGFDKVKQAYGLTECVVVTMSRDEDPLSHVKGTTGPAVPGLEVRLGEADEIQVKGPLVMQGYFEDPEATAAAVTPDGWLRTGDVGRMDEHGCVSVVDRIKDLVIVGGFNVAPVEVENALSRHPDVAEVAVVGVGDERMGQVCHAWVVRTPGATPQAADLITWARGQLANFKVPRHLEFVDALPRNAAGKVLKTELRDSAQGASAGL